MSTSIRRFATRVAAAPTCIRQETFPDLLAAGNALKNWAAMERLKGTPLATIMATIDYRDASAVLCTLVNREQVLALVDDDESLKRDFARAPELPNSLRVWAWDNEIYAISPLELMLANLKDLSAEEG